MYSAKNQTAKNQNIALLLVKYFVILTGNQSRLLNLHIFSSLNAYSRSEVKVLEDKTSYLCNGIAKSFQSPADEFRHIL